MHHKVSCNRNWPCCYLSQNGDKAGKGFAVNQVLAFIFGNDGRLTSFIFAGHIQQLTGGKIIERESSQIVKSQPEIPKCVDV